MVFGKTTADKSLTSKQENISTSEITSQDFIAKSKQGLQSNQLEKLLQLENSVVRGNVKDQQINAYKQLHVYWHDSLHNPLMGAYYMGESAKLENSEKNLTFAARLLIEQLMVSEDAVQQKWIASQAKEFFEKALIINPANDSSKAGVAATYLFGNITDNPMEGISMLKEVTTRNPQNLYARMILGVGSIRSGQMDKAIEHFKIVAENQPDNVQAVLSLAEAYDRTGDTANAVKWYKVAKVLIDLPEAKSEIDKRIDNLNK